MIAPTDKAVICVGAVNAQGQVVQFSHPAFPTLQEIELLIDFHLGASAHHNVPGQFLLIHLQVLPHSCIRLD